MSIENILIWVVVGAIAGWITSALMNVRAGLLTTILIGIVGAVVGGALANLLGFGRVEVGFSIPAIITAIIGSVIFVALVRSLRRI